MRHKGLVLLEPGFKKVKLINRKQMIEETIDKSKVEIEGKVEGQKISR